MANDEAADRLEAELELLQAMYPEAISFSPKAREVKYVHVTTPDMPASTLILRLPDLYPTEGVPEVLSASGPQREDLRSSAKEAVSNLGLLPGEEVLDAIILSFQDILQSRALLLSEGQDKARNGSSRQDRDDEQFRTVVIWLHHLLNTNKRKLALHPTMVGSQINGMTKPGYPGVLVFSGLKSAVDAHVSELRSQRWQAFQVRYDSEDDVEVDNKSWSFEHGTGIREVESMSDLTQSISNSEQRRIFLNAIGVR